MPAANAISLAVLCSFTFAVIHFEYIKRMNLVVDLLADKQKGTIKL